MTDKLTRDQWETVLDRAGGDPSVGELARALAEADMVGPDDLDGAQQIVECALKAGPLRERDTGVFGSVAVSSDQEDETTERTVDSSPIDDQREATADTKDELDWQTVTFDDTEADVYPDEWGDRERWMAHTHGDKKPFAPWADRDHEAADPEKDARWKWGIEDNYADLDTAREWAEKHPRLAGVTYLLGDAETEPFAFVDGDDVRCPETGEVHPEFLSVLQQLGASYADVSVSGTGVHVPYRGDLPEGVSQAVIQIDDEPWGANEDLPEIEFYDHSKVCVSTGDHAPETPTSVREWDADALEAILEAHDIQTGEGPVSHDTDHERPALDDHEPSATTADETTDDIRDLFKAVDDLRPRDLPLKTTQVGEDATGWEKWDPSSYRPSSGGDSLHTPDRVTFYDQKNGETFGVLKLYALEQGIISRASHDLRGEDWWEAVEQARDDGAPIPQLEEQSDYRTDPREVEATVDPRRAWEAAGRVEPDEIDTDGLSTDGAEFCCPACGEPLDVVRAVAVDEGMADSCDESLGAVYSEAYSVAREQYDAPLPEYYATTDVIARFDAVLDVIGEVTFWDFDTEALNSEITAEGDDVGGDAVRALNPAWRESESEESVLVFESGTVWDADSERVLDALRFVALDAGLIDTPDESLSGLFSDVYGLARREYTLPLPRWEPAADGERAVTPQLPPSEELLDARDVDGVDADALANARDAVEELVDEATAQTEDATVITSLPATGKTTATVKGSKDEPRSYLAPRKELQQQAVEKAANWNVDAYVLPVFSEERVRPEVLSAAVSHVRERGTDCLRDRWQIVAEALDEGDNDALDSESLFVDEEDDTVDLDRATCPTAEGEHGADWALVAHAARRLGYTPAEIHSEAHGLFGAPLPCTCDGDHPDGEADCEYAEGWADARSPEDPPDLLVGSYVHAHVESVRTVYRKREQSEEIVTNPRPVVLDEFPGEAFTSDYGEEALDFATWLARSLRPDVADRRDMYETDLWSDDWVQAWLSGTGEQHDGVADAISALAAQADLLDAREAAGDILGEVDHELLQSAGLARPLEAFKADDLSASEAFSDLATAVEVDPRHAAAGVAAWVEDAVVDPLQTALEKDDDPGVSGVAVEELPIDDDLADLVHSAVEAVESRAEAARPRLKAAVDALRGGRDGCHRLAAWAADGYAHPDAHHFLAAVATPTGEDSDVARARRVETDELAFDPDATEGTVVDVVDTGERAVAAVDRNGHGARLHTPPGRTAAGGEDVPVVGLDATGRETLWSVVLGEQVSVADIHETPAERAEFLENALDLRVIKAATEPRFYEGDPASKDTDSDVALLQALADEYAGLEAPRQRGDTPTTVGKPAAITTKGVREVLENDDRLDDVVSAWENYGNVTGANDLGSHRLAALLGCQHYGDHAVERFALLAGESVNTDRDRRGARLDYESEVANSYLQHMTEDQSMQAILRFARGDSGATVVARTNMLREDLPVVGRGQVVETWSDTATQITRAWRRLGEEFTAADVADAVDVTRRQVRRVLAELVEAGYLRRVESAPGTASVYEPAGTPDAGEVELPERHEAVAPGQGDSTQYYTENVRVVRGDPALDTVERRPTAAPPAPTRSLAAPEGDPPGS